MCNEFFGISLYVGVLCSDFSMFDNWTALGVKGMKVNSDRAMIPEKVRHSVHLLPPS